MNGSNRGTKMETIEELKIYLKEYFDINLTDEMVARVEKLREPTCKLDRPGVTLIAPYRGQFGVHRILRRGDVVYYVSDTYISRIK